MWWSCNRDLEFRTNAPKILELTPVVNTNNKKVNEIWEYNEYWIILKDFRYIPQLVAAIKSRARLHWRYDIKFRDDDGDISTPRYEIYRFTLDLPELWAHVWYGIWWKYELTEEQKQIAATANKYYTKLKIVLNDNVFGNKWTLPDNFGHNWTVPNWWIDWNIWNWTDWTLPDNFWVPWKTIPWKWKIPWKNPWSSNWNQDNWNQSWNSEWQRWNVNDNQGEQGWNNNWFWQADDNSWWEEDNWFGEQWQLAEDNNQEDYYPWVEWRPAEWQEEDIPENIDQIDTSRGWLLNWKWVYPEDLELRFVPKTAIGFVKNFFEKRTPAKRAKLYSQILMMIETYENNPTLRVKKAKLIKILKDLRDIMVVYRLR